jgi:glycosyltransferase involved in cell wall biosynthesis
MESVLRVCLFTASFLPLVGGAERCADLVVRGLIARGHETMVLAQRTGALPGELPYPVRHYRRPPWQHLWPEALAWPLVKGHRAWRFEVILAFDSYPCGYAACWIKKRLGVPVVVSPRGADVQEGFFALRKPRVANCLAIGYRNADRIIAISRWAAQRVRAIVGDRLPPIDVVYNGIDMEADASLRAQAREQAPSMPLAKRFILHLARVDHNKQQTTAIRAVHILCEEFRRRGLQYAIAGDGRGVDEVRRLIAELGVGDIVVCLGTRIGL